jgi:hypothetical protein
MPSKIFFKTQKIGLKTSSNSALTLPNSRCQRELIQNRISRKFYFFLKPNIIFYFIISNPRVWGFVNLKTISNNFATHIAPNTYDNKNKKLIISALMNTNIKLEKRK